MTAATPTPRTDKLAKTPLRSGHELEYRAALKKWAKLSGELELELAEARQLAITDCIAMCYSKGEMRAAEAIDKGVPKVDAAAAREGGDESK
jgi:hypothetical protein